MYVTFIILMIVTIADSVPHAQKKTTIKNSTENYNGTTITSYSWNDTVILDWISQLFGQKPTVTTVTPIIDNTEHCPKCKCGITNKKNRIVGGVETEVNQYPWMTMLLYRGRFYCGGSIINSRYVLTAAHCVDRFQKNLMTIRILEHNRNSTTESEIQEYKVEKIIRHADYSTINYNNDIALLKIEGKFSFKKKFRPVCLPEHEKSFSGETGIVTGWGAIQEGGPLSTYLQEVRVPILSNPECHATNYPARKITDNMLCAGYKEGGKDSCQGDSGGPLHIMYDTIHSIVGIVSWGEGCAQPNYPGVYTRVNRFLTWITENTNDACYC